MLLKRPVMSSSQFCVQEDWGASDDAVDCAQTVNRCIKEYVVRGFTILPKLIPGHLLCQMADHVAAIYSERLPFRIHRPGLGICWRSKCDPATVAARRYALLDSHNVSAAALELVTWRPMARLLQNILDGIPIVMQSQLFEFSSEKPSHADVPYLHLDNPRQTTVGWIAMEDIDDSRGPLYVVPGSHRAVAPYEFSNNNIFSSGEDIEDIRRYADYLDAECLRQGLQRVSLTVPAGTVLVFHPCLIHGAHRPLSDTHTRRSLAIHYSTVGSYERDPRRASGESILMQRNGVAYFALEHPGHIEGRLQ